MYKKILIVSIALFIFAATLFAEEKQDPVAVIIKTSGQVFLHRGDTNEAMKHGTVLYSGDEIVSGEASLAIVKFVDKGAIIKIFSNSILTINAKKNVKKLDKKLYAEIGNIWSQVKKESGEYEVSTPTTVAAVKGTEFLVSVDEKLTMVSTFSGVVEVRNEFGTANISAGKTATVSKEKAPDVAKTQTSSINSQILEEINTEPTPEEGNGETGDGGGNTEDSEDGGEDGGDEGEQGNMLEIQFENENGEMKTMIIYY
ncbi:MAG: FecR family protein [Candidatus Cloacimonadota bacterium]|nr:FecR family protein [Candidatus Cloacimonadota bacterium]